MKMWTVFIAILLVIAFVLSACSQQAPAPTQNPTTALPQSSAAKPTSSSPASSAPSPSAPAGVKTLKFAYDMTPVSAITAGWTWFAPEFEKRTNGRYKIDFYPNQTLIKQSEQLNGLAAGIADFSTCQLVSQQQAFPVNAVVSLPSTAFPDTMAGHQAARDAARALYDKFPAIAGELKQFKVVFRHPLPANIIITKKTKVVLPSDMKGLKIASLGMDKDIVSMAGGAPVNMVPPDIYQALDKGVVDGAMVGWFHMVSQHFEEITNYFNDYSFAQLPQYVLMNTNSWNSLSPDVQKVINDLAPEVETRSSESYMSQIEKGKGLVKAKSATVTTPTPDQRKVWSDLIKPLDGIWLDQMKAKGVTDAPAMLDFMHQKAADAWSKNQ